MSAPRYYLDEPQPYLFYVIDRGTGMIILGPTTREEATQRRDMENAKQEAKATPQKASIPQPFHHEDGRVSYQSPEETRELCKARDAKKNREAASADLLASLQELLAARENQIRQHAYLGRSIDTGREREAEAHSIRSDRRMAKAEVAARAAIKKATQP